MKLRKELSDSNKISYIIRECSSGDSNKQTVIYNRLFAFSFLISGALFIPFLFYTRYPIAGYILIGIFYLLTYILVFGAYFLYKLMRMQQSIRILNGLIDSIESGDWHWAKETALGNQTMMDPTVLRHPSAMYLLGQILLHNGNKKEGDTLVDLARKSDSNLEELDISFSLIENNAEYLRKSLAQANNLSLAFSFQKMWTIKTVRYLIISSLALVFLLHFLIMFSRIFSR